MREDIFFARMVRISFYIALSLVVVFYIIIKLVNSPVNSLLVTNALLILTFIPAVSLITALPFARRKIKLLILAVVAEMVAAYYLAFHA